MPYDRVRERYLYDYGEMDVLSLGQWTTHSRNLQTSQEYNADKVGSFATINSLRIRKANRTAVLNGSALDNDGNPTRVARDWPLWPAYPPIDYHGVPQLDLQVMATSLMAKTNPSRAGVQVPVFLAEMRDLPMMIRAAGDSLFKTLAKGNLSYQFGWKPLVSDIEKMLKFNQSVDRRMEELERLQSGSGLKRRAIVEEVEGTETSGSMTLNSTHVFVSADWTENCTRRVWGTIKWRPSSSYEFPRDVHSRRTEAAKLVYGVKGVQQLKNVWDALPWSWAIDWFSNVGEFIQANNNSIGFVDGNIAIMNHTKTTRIYRITSKPNGMSVSPTAPESVREWKYRDPVSALTKISASQPALSRRQLSILGSLAILRGRKGTGI